MLPFLLKAKGMKTGAIDEKLFPHPQTSFTNCVYDCALFVIESESEAISVIPRLCEEVMTKQS